MENSQLAIRVIMLPRDTNGAGTIFGGSILSHLDLAGAAIAQSVHPGRYVTVAMREVEFIAPVYVGDLVSFYGRVEKIGRTSVTIHIHVEAQRVSDPEQIAQVTEAEIVYVHVDSSGEPVPIES